MTTKDELRELVEQIEGITNGLATKLNRQFWAYVEARGAGPIQEGTLTSTQQLVNIPCKYEVLNLVDALETVEAAIADVLFTLAPEKEACDGS